MSFAKLWWLQLVYLGFAVGYNLVSIGLEQINGQSLYAGSKPWTNIGLLVGLLTSVLLLGRLGYLRWYAVLNALLMVLLLYSGVLIHLLRYFDGDLDRYLSVSAWWWAVAINLVGAVLGLYLSWLAYREGSA